MVESLLSSEFLTTVIKSSLFHGTVLTIIAWLLCLTFLSKVRPAVRAIVWTIVLLKFLVPPILPSSFSLSHFLTEFTHVQIWDTSREIRSAPLPEVDQVYPTQKSKKYWSWQKDPFRIFRLALVVYLIGFVFLLLHMIATAVKTNLFVRNLPIAPNDLRGLVLRLSKKLNLRNAPEVKVCPDKISPFIVGLVRPVLVIPEQLVQKLAPSLLSALIVHEIAHVKRGDLFVRLIQRAAQLIFFFWPPLRWVCRKVERSTELACDHWAIVFSGVRSKDYARLLLEVAKEYGNTEFPETRLAFARKGRFLEKRFYMILKNNHLQSPRVSWIMVPAILLWAVFSLSGGVVANSQQEGAENKQVRKSWVLKTNGPGENIRIPADAFPDADLDGDGRLTMEELKAYHELHPDAFKMEVTEKEDGGIHFLFEVKSEDGSGIWIEENSDSPGLQNKKIIRLVTESQTDGSESEATVFITGDNHRGIHEVIEEEGADGEIRKHIFVETDYSMDPDTMLQEHPEADLNGDGTIDREEMRSYFKRLHEGSHDMLFVSADGAVHELKEGERDVQVVKITEDDVQDFDFDGDGRFSDEELKAMKAEHLSWIDEDGAEHTITATGDHIFVRIDRRHGNHDVLLIQESTSERMTDKGAVIRKKDFLKEHPEADLNGDGVISKQEAEAFAAKLQAKQKSRSKQEQ